jgi:O-antigen/teichoic acid export membrane protein
VAVGFGAYGFSEYVIARRTLTLLLPLGVLGLDVALGRLVAIAAVRDQRAAESYLVAALPIAGAGLAATAAVILAFPETVAQILFGSTEYAAVARTLPLCLAGATAQVLVYSDLRGLHRMRHANIVLVANHAVMPLATLLLAGDVVGILTALGIAWCAVSTAAFLTCPRSQATAPGRTQELFRFGIRRTPGDVVQLLFFALPVIVTAQVGTIVDAGIVAFAITALGLVASALQPVTNVLLPTAARLIGRSEVAVLRAHVTRILQLLVPPIVLGIVAIEFFADDILRRYLGADFVRGSGILRLVLAGALPWSLFILLRSVVDAHHERAIIARNLIAGFVCFVALAPFSALELGAVSGVLTAFVIGLYVIGALTVYEAYRALGPDSGARNADDAASG